MTVVADTETWLWSGDELTDDDIEHYACPCSPQFTLCGIYDESAEECDDAPPSPNDCKDCLEVQKRPCGRCGA